MIKILLLIIALGDFTPAPDWDQPHIYSKACIYCHNCTPRQVRHALSPIPILGEFRCQQTDSVMTFDSLRVCDMIQWGRIEDIKCYWNYEDSDSVTNAWHEDEDGTKHYMKNVEWRCDTLIQIDTTGIMRVIR